MLVEERSLTSGMLLEETNSPEIGICLSTPLRTRRSRKELYSSAKLGMFSESRPMRDRPIVCWRVKPVGEPCAGNPHARFDERECGNGAWHAAIEARTGKPRHGTMPKPTPPRHLSTLPVFCTSGTHPVHGSGPCQGGLNCPQYAYSRR